MSERGRNWLRLGQQCTEGLLSVAERKKVESQDDWLLDEPVEGEDLEQWRITRTADHAAWYTLASAIIDAAVIPAGNVAGVKGIMGEPSGRSSIEYYAERKAQTFLFRDIFGNPFRPISTYPEWLTPTVSSLAQAAYEERALPSGELDPARLAVLSDALEEAGCDNADILNHLRGPGPHVRGCWALDLVLGKE